MMSRPQRVLAVICRRRGLYTGPFSSNGMSTPKRRIRSRCCAPAASGQAAERSDEFAPSKANAHLALPRQGALSRQHSTAQARGPYPSEGRPSGGGAACRSARRMPLPALPGGSASPPRRRSQSWPFGPAHSAATRRCSACQCKVHRRAARTKVHPHVAAIGPAQADVGLSADHLLRERLYPIDVNAGRAEVHPHVAAIGPTQVRKRLSERRGRKSSPRDRFRRRAAVSMGVWQGQGPWPSCGSRPSRTWSETAPI
jgi:hypothetical protein